MARNVRIPVLIAASMIDNVDMAPHPSHMDMVTHATSLALRDGIDLRPHLHHVDVVAMTRFFSDSSHLFACPYGGADNPPEALARRIGASPSNTFYAEVGGNSPQYLVNYFMKKIAQSSVNMAIIAGGESFKNQISALKEGHQLDWTETTGTHPTPIGDPRPGIRALEAKYGLGLPNDTYTLFENALAHHSHHSPDEHTDYMGNILARMSRKASQTPCAIHKAPLSSRQITSPSPENRMVSWPYSKRMCANPMVNHAACLILTHDDLADEMGVPQCQRIYLNGYASTTEKWHISERVNYHSSPAIGLGAMHALAMAGLATDDISLMDIYSCYPSAVEICCNEMGIAIDDPRGLTLTGGLAAFGGAGNNYSLMAIAKMVEELRINYGKHGFIFANGWYLTKHDFGVYSTSNTHTTYPIDDMTHLQSQIDALASPACVEHASGSARIETFSMPYDKNGPQSIIIIGRDRISDVRFFARMEVTTSNVARLQSGQAIGSTIAVEHSNGFNTARFES